jgi:hypothetical protein
MSIHSERVLALQRLDVQAIGGGDPAESIVSVEVSAISLINCCDSDV